MPSGEALIEMPQPRAALPQKKEAGQSHWLRSLVLEKPLARARGAGGMLD